MRVGKHDQRLAEYIDQYWRENYHAPSMREMAEHCNTSTCVIYNALQRIAPGRFLLGGIGEARAVVPYWVRDAIAEANTMKGSWQRGDTHEQVYSCL